MSSFSPDLERIIKQTRQALESRTDIWSNMVDFVTCLTPSPFDYYPYLFLEAFPSLAAKDIQSLTVAGRLFASTLLLYDQLIDRTSTKYLVLDSALSIQAQQFESYGLLHQLFPPNRNFWCRFRSYMIGYADACSQELRFASRECLLKDYDEVMAFHIAKGKSGVAKTAVAGLAELANDDRFFTPLTESIDCFNIASQMFDDLSDWKEDLRGGLPSLILSRVIDELPVLNNSDNWEEITNYVSHKIYYDGHASYILELALEFLDRADNLIQEIPNLYWKNVIERSRSTYRSALRDFTQIINKNIKRVAKQPKFVLQLPPINTPWQQLAWDALDFIVRQWQIGWSEARHVMVFPRQQGFTGDSDYQYGDIFQRAMIADILCDANEILADAFQLICDREANYLINSYLQNGIGGWSYFPNLPEQPPDADDLAQVMQVLLRLNLHVEVEKYCETPLKVLLEECSYPDGSFETWIVPASDRTPEQERHVEFINSAWGRGADTDVIANLLYALTFYDKLRFSAVICRGITYLESQQRNDGSWLSTWYHGAFYGTYVCLRLLISTKPDSPAIPKALNFLRNSQLSDGGWGATTVSDPLSTAFALLGLGLAHKSDCKCDGQSRDSEIAEPALKYLQVSQLEDKAWPKSEFIRMEVGRATGDAISILSYGSRTITTAFVLKASVLWHQLSARDALTQEVTKAELIIR